MTVSVVLVCNILFCYCAKMQRVVLIVWQMVFCYVDNVAEMEESEVVVGQFAQYAWDAG